MPLQLVKCGARPELENLWRRVDASTKGEYKERRLGQKILFAFSDLRGVRSSPLDRTTKKLSP
jgi:hypothetical protein